jgi:hypothetical protein
VGVVVAGEDDEDVEEEPKLVVLTDVDVELVVLVEVVEVEYPASEDTMTPLLLRKMAR